MWGSNFPMPHVTSGAAAHCLATDMESSRAPRRHAHRPLVRHTESSALAGQSLSAVPWHAGRRARAQPVALHTAS